LKILEHNEEDISVSDIEDLKQDLAAYLSRAETPESAAKNAGLIYDPMIEYVSEATEQS
jgi:hypothetical protein